MPSGEMAPTVSPSASPGDVAQSVPPVATSENDTGQPLSATAPAEEMAPPVSPLAAYQALSASQARNYDRTQDISPRQMLILLEVCERTGTSLGQALATGEHESARTWNDYVRPTLNDGRLGSAAGVWQFMPATFQDIIKRYGTRLLAASAADPASGREHLDLGDGPFSDAQVRTLIQETVDGKRGADDGELKLLRHNFAVLAFAKHYLSLDSGATTPEEDYLFHFLGAAQGRRVLALARGEARDTLCVKAPPTPLPESEPAPELALADDPEPVTRAAPLPRRTMLAPIESSLQARASLQAPRVSARWEPATASPGSTFDYAIANLKPNRVPLGAPGTGGLIAPALTPEPAIWSPPAPEPPPPVSSRWGFDADSPVVTGNLGMFYRDGKSQSQPYTWGEFIDHLARRVRAKDQPAMVRAKYGVGFDIEGGDLPERAFNPDTITKAAGFRHEFSGEVLIPEALALGPLDPEERRAYKKRLAELLRQGEDRPLETLPPETLSALRHLGFLPLDVRETSTADPEVRKALHQFRKRIGKDQPDDPAHIDRLMPAERIALELYDRRITRYAALQAAQQATLTDAADLSRIGKMPVGLRKSAAPHIAVLQTVLAERGLLKQPTQKVVWRDKKRKKHVTYQTAPFTGVAGKATLAAINSFQWRHGLRNTGGVLDAVTLGMLGLPPMGPEIFRPLSGPYCAIETTVATASACERPTPDRRGALGDLAPPPRALLLALADQAPMPIGEAEPPQSSPTAPEPTPAPAPTSTLDASGVAE